MQITRMAHEKLLAAAQYAKTETARAYSANQAFMRLSVKHQELEARHEEVLKNVGVLVTKVTIRDEALVQLALRLSFHGDAEPIAGTE
jgi:hypothetical protein